jgi:hypothetical protein
VFKPAAYHDAAATTLFAQLESWAGALKGVRALTPQRDEGRR